MGNIKFNIFNAELYKVLFEQVYEKSISHKLEDSYMEFVEDLITYLEVEKDNVIRIRTLNIIQIEFEALNNIKILPKEDSDIRILYSNKVRSIANKELELIYKQMQFPKYFIETNEIWQSPLYLNHNKVKLVDMMELVCGYI